MKRKMLSVFLAFALMIAAIPAFTLNTKAAGSVVINSTNFPNKTFRNYIKSNFDTDGNGALSTAELQAVTQILIPEKGITNLKGISHFTELQVLDCSSNGLKTLDVSKNTKLAALKCASNSLTSLNVSANTALDILWCSENQITSLDVTKNLMLEVLYCDSNKLTSLNVTKNAGLVSLDCSKNQLTALNVKSNSNLELLYCNDNQITSLNVSSNLYLCILNCANNKLTSVNVTKNTALAALDCSGMGLSTLDVTNNPELSVLYCYGNKISSLNIGNCEKLIAAYDSMKKEETGKILYYEIVYDESHEITDIYYLYIDENTSLIGRKPRIEEQPANIDAALGNYIHFIVKASGGDLKYQWYYRTSADGVWTKVSAESGKTASYEMQVKARHNGYQYRCKVTNSQGYVYTKVRTLHVISAAPVIKNHPVSQHVVAGEAAVFSVTATGNGLKYQWYYQTPEGKRNAVSAASGKTATLKVNAKAYHDGYRYECVVSNAVGTQWSKVATLYVSYDEPAITAGPQNKAVRVDDVTYFFANATGGDLNYQWYYRTSETGAWKETASSTGKTQSLEVSVKERHNGYQYRCKVWNTFGEVFTEVAELTVVTEPATIVSQPTDQVVLEGEKVTLSVEATGRAVSYLWQYRASEKDSWSYLTDEPGAYANYSFTAKARHNGYQYRAGAKNAMGIVYSDVITLTVVSNAPQITTQPEDKSVAEGEKATFTVKATGEALSYQWYYRTSETGEWAEVSAASGKTAKLSVTTKARHNGYQYRCVVTNLMGSAESEIVTLTVN